MDSAAYAFVHETALRQAEPVSQSDMLWIPSGEFWMGSNRHYPEERPEHEVLVDGFWIDRCSVTNRAFARFVDATGYKTVAENWTEGPACNGEKPDLLAPSSVIFQKPATRFNTRERHHWWIQMRGADWRHPQGPASSIEGIENHPVVHIGYEDAEAYARWVGKELPSEAEWEYAARGGLDDLEYVWGAEFLPDGRFMANTWQGEFPWENLASDGYEGTSPVGFYPANGYGLYDMAGNVWQWTSDWYQPHGRVERAPYCTLYNPRGGSRDGSVDPHTPLNGSPRKVIKGGSYLCAPNYSRRYRPAARMAQPVDGSTCDLGFRCVVRGKGLN